MTVEVVGLKVFTVVITARYWFLEIVVMPHLCKFMAENMGGGGGRSFLVAPMGLNNDNAVFSSGSCSLLLLRLPRLPCDMFDALRKYTMALRGMTQQIRISAEGRCRMSKMNE